MKNKTTAPDRPQPTPGPWLARTYPDARGQVTAIKIWAGSEFSGPMICGIAAADCTRSLVEDSANARLIAAAPQLLQALQACVTALEEVPCISNKQGAAAVNARAALRQAQGGQP